MKTMFSRAVVLTGLCLALGGNAWAQKDDKKVVFEGKFGYGERDQLAALARMQSATIVEDLDNKSDYLVIPDMTGGKTVQKKAQSLNSKGASIQVIDGGDFKKLVEPKVEEILAMLRRGSKAAELFNKAVVEHFSRSYKPQWTISGEKFDGLDLSGFNLYSIAFEGCSFVGAKLGRANFSSTENCDFTRVKADVHSDFGQSRNSVFKEAQISALSTSPCSRRAGSR